MTQPTLDGMPARPVRTRLRPVQLDPWVGPGAAVLARDIELAQATLARMEAKK